MQVADNVTDLYFAPCGRRLLIGTREGIRSLPGPWTWPVLRRCMPPPSEPRCWRLLPWALDMAGAAPAPLGAVARERSQRGGVQRGAKRHRGNRQPRRPSAGRGRPRLEAAGAESRFARHAARRASRPEGRAPTDRLWRGKPPGGDRRRRFHGVRLELSGKPPEPILITTARESDAPIARTATETDLDEIHIAFSGDGRRLAGAFRSRVVRVWDLDHPAAPPVEFHGTNSDVSSVAFRPDRRHLVATTGDVNWRENTDPIPVRLWDLEKPAAIPLAVTPPSVPTQKDPGRKTAPVSTIDP